MAMVDANYFGCNIVINLSCRASIDIKTWDAHLAVLCVQSATSAKMYIPAARSEGIIYLYICVYIEA